MAGDKDLIIDQYTDYVFVCNITECEVPQDLTGCSFYGDIRTDYSATSTVLASISASVLNATGGELQLFIPKATIDTWTYPQTYNKLETKVKVGVYDLMKLDGNGITTKFFEGDVYLKRSATQR